MEICAIRELSGERYAGMAELADAQDLDAVTSVEDFSHGMERSGDCGNRRLILS